MRQTVKRQMETKPTQQAHDRQKRSGGQGIWQKRAGFRQGQTLVCYTVCVVVSPVWAHDSEAPWAVVVPEAWHRFRGQTRQGGWHLLGLEHEVSRCRSRVLLVLLDTGLASGLGPSLGWDETDAAVAGCKRSRRECKEFPPPPTRGYLAVRTCRPWQAY